MLRDEILDKLCNAYGHPIPQRMTVSYISKHGLYDELKSAYDTTYSLPEKIYCIINNIDRRPTCKSCGRPLKFINGVGYRKFCSRKCSATDTDVKLSNSKSVSASLIKAYELHHDSIIEKRSNTIGDRYGKITNTPFKVESVKAKIRRTMLDRYGVDNPLKLKKFRGEPGKRSKILSTLRNKLDGYDVTYHDDGTMLVNNLCPVHGTVTINPVDFYNRVHRGRNGNPCPICNPISSYSSLEDEFDKILVKLNITDYSRNVKGIIGKMELDFFIPEKNIAFELNGVYWHSEIYKEPDYHIDKMNACVNRGIRLVYVWEDDMYERPDIVESMVSSILGMAKNRIYARKCTVTNITSSKYREFLDDNHLQGSINSSIRYGLMYNGNLVEVMGFGKPRISLGMKYTDGCYELQRLCTLKGFTVVGGAGKLLTTFERNNDVSMLISFAKRDHSIGTVYEKLGFTLHSITGPSVYWVVNGHRFHRFKFRKDRISDESNAGMSAVDIMHSRGYFRDYDSGNLKYIKTYKSETEIS